MQLQQHASAGSILKFFTCSRLHVRRQIFAGQITHIVSAHSHQGAVSKMCGTACNISILVNLMLFLVIYLSPMPER